jgi:hypothetical protein
MSYRFMRLMFKLNMRVNIKFFFTVFDIFRVEFLLSAFANFRFLKANSTFGFISLVCSIVVVGMTLFIIGISAWKMRQIKTLKDESYNLKLKIYETKKETISVRKDLLEMIRKLPWLRNWEFLIEDMHPKLMGIGMYFFVYTALKEFITIFCIMTFIGTPTMQLIPCMLMSLLSCLVMIFKRPYRRKLENILNLIVESAYFLIFIAFLSLHFILITTENENKRQNLGYFMIGLIIVIICRILVDLVVGLVKTYHYIKKYCSKRNKVEPVPLKKSTGIKNKRAKKKAEKGKDVSRSRAVDRVRERDDSKADLNQLDDLGPRVEGRSNKLEKSEQRKKQGLQEPPKINIATKKLP